MTRQQMIDGLQVWQSATISKGIMFPDGQIITIEELVSEIVKTSEEVLQENERLKHQIKGLRKKVNRHKRLIGQLKSELKRYDKETSI